MAYIDAKSTKMIRTALRKEFPEFKLSLRNKDHRSIHLRIEKGPTDFGLGNHAQINHFYPEHYDDSHILSRMIEIMNTAGERENFDKSNAQIDYFCVGYYINVSLGSWDKPFVKIK